MINREWKQVVVSAFSDDTDAYGQPHKGTPISRNVNMVIKTKSITNVNDPRFIEVTDIGLTADNQIAAGNEVTYGTKKYLVLSVILSSRLNQV